MPGKIYLKGNELYFKKFQNVHCRMERTASIIATKTVLTTNATGSMEVVCLAVKRAYNVIKVLI